MGESQTVEFKKSLAARREILETISAFANTEGGRVVIGVEEARDGSVKKTVGVEVKGKEVENLSNEIKQNTDPVMYPSIKVDEFEGKPVLVVDVKESRVKPVFAKIDGIPVAYKRVGKTNQKIDASELRQIISEGKEFLWDSQVCEEATLKDIDEEKVKWFLRKAKSERNFDIEPETPVKEALDRLELMKTGKLTNACILLFGRKPQKFFLQAETRCARFKGTSPVKPFLDMKVFGGSIFDQVDKSLNFVLEHVPMKVYLAGKPEREEKYEYPPDAIREAIINAICHRNYEPSTNVQVRVFDDRIEIWGCGPLPEPLTPESLKKKHRSILRNPLIGKCFFRVKLIEQWGTGTNDIIDMCLEWNLPEPLFEHVTGDFVVTFRKSAITEDLLKEKGLNERQMKVVLHTKDKNRITNKEYQRITGVSKPTATRELKELVEKKVFVRHGETGKGTFYSLNKGLIKGS